MVHPMKSRDVVPKTILVVVVRGVGWGGGRVGR